MLDLLCDKKWCFMFSKVGLNLGKCYMNDEIDFEW